MTEHDSLGPTSDQLARMVLEMAGELEADEKLIKEAILAAAESGNTDEVASIVRRWLALPIRDVVERL